MRAIDGVASFALGLIDDPGIPVQGQEPFLALAEQTNAWKVNKVGQMTRSARVGIPIRCESAPTCYASSRGWNVVKIEDVVGVDVPLVSAAFAEHFKLEIIV